MRDLEGKNAIITGARRGIGRAIVELFAKNGCNIWACARKYDEEFEKDINDVSQKYDVSITPIYFDLMNMNEIKDGFKSIYKEKKKIDILVNVAGIIHSNLFQMTTMEQIYETYQTNVFSAMQLTQFVLKNMTRNKSGSIINISSIAGLDPKQTNSIYGSSKAALIFFTKALASEVGGIGIRVNSIAPGNIETDMTQSIKDKYGDSMLDNCILNSCAMSRYGKSEEIAEMAVFLASDKASFVNGEVIRVDGGSK